MGLETASTIFDLNEANPDGQQDTRAEGDDHIRLIKDALKKTFLRDLEANRPAAGTADRLFVATDTKRIYRDTGAAWDQLGPDPEPPGLLAPFAGSTAPTGYLLCDGSAVSRTTYSDLFDVVGTTYGVGDESTTFNLPDLRGRFLLGKDNMGGTSADTVAATAADELGGTGGEEDHTLTVNEMPTHNHTGSAQSAGNHQHTFRSVFKAPSGSDVQDVLFSTGQGTRTEFTNSAGAHTHSLSINNKGSGEAHNNMPPYITVNWVIKT